MLFGKKIKQTVDLSQLEKNIRFYIDGVRDELERERLEKERLEKERKESETRYSLKDTTRYSLEDDPSLYEKIESEYPEWEKKTAVKESFSSSVLKYMEQKRLSPSKLYKKAELDRKLFSRLKNDYMYQPTRTTAIKFCLGLELKIDEAEKLLEKAGYSLSKSQSFDLIIRYCIENGYTDIETVNEILRRFEEKTL